MLDRESFLRGVAALKSRLVELETEQREDKRIIRMPHNSSECRAAVYAQGVARGAKHLNYYDVSAVQSHVAIRKMRITAVLVTYNLVRGKGVPYRVDKYCRAMYTRALQNTRQIFDNAAAAVPVG